MGARWEAGIRSHFGKHAAIWAKSKRSILQNKSVRKGALTEGGSSSAALMVVFVTVAQRVVISIAAWGWFVPEQEVVAASQGEGEHVDIRGVSLALITIKMVQLYADSLRFRARSGLPLRSKPAEG